MDVDHLDVDPEHPLEDPTLPPPLADRVAIMATIAVQAEVLPKMIAPHIMMKRRPAHLAERSHPPQKNQAAGLGNHPSVGMSDRRLRAKPPRLAQSRKTR